MASTAAVVLIFVSCLQITTSQRHKRHSGDIYSFHINATVTSRYAITVITSRVANRHDNSSEIDFHVKIPKTAFISKFRMTIDGKMYDGVVKKKEEAEQQYKEAVDQGQTAGLVSAVGRTLEDFRTSVSIAAHNKVTFELTYEELLQRRLGNYELLINARPGQIVRDFKINVNVYEKPGIKFLKVEGSLASKTLTTAVTKSHVDKEAWITFSPTEVQQTQCDGCGEHGLSGDLKIIYDVERPHSNGEMLVVGGFFAHYFAPADLPRIPKNVVFVIDRSGSMLGQKISQTRTALLKILDDLAENDRFGLICFDDKISPWKRTLIGATQQNVKAAKEFVGRIESRGSTDINAAVLEGVKMIQTEHKEGVASILILLTDGQPNSGEADPDKIEANVRRAIGKGFPLYCLGFGFDVRFEFLQKMAQENGGVARRIYEGTDAVLQLEGFYEEVAVPLLTNVKMAYKGATHLTQSAFIHYYNGSEIVVAGQISNITDFSTAVIAVSTNTEVMTYTDIKPSQDENPSPVMSGFENFLQRLWAYLTLKQLLDREVMLSGEEKKAVKQEALDLALRYGFVTPLTSMVVTKPQAEGSHVAHKPKEGESSSTPLSRTYSSGFGGYQGRAYSGASTPRSFQPGARFSGFSPPPELSPDGPPPGFSTPRAFSPGAPLSNFSPPVSSPGTGISSFTTPGTPESYSRPSHCRLSQVSVPPPSSSHGHHSVVSRTAERPSRSRRVSSPAPSRGSEGSSAFRRILPGQRYIPRTMAEIRSELSRRGIRFRRSARKDILLRLLWISDNRLPHSPPTPNQQQQADGFSPELLRSPEGIDQPGSPLPGFRSPSPAQSSSGADSPSTASPVPPPLPVVPPARPANTHRRPRALPPAPAVSFNVPPADVARQASLPNRGAEPPPPPVTASLSFPTPILSRRLEPRSSPHPIPRQHLPRWRIPSPLFPEPCHHHPTRFRLRPTPSLRLPLKRLP
ncbi:hypothetical protein ACEWY4_022763 [Coilia grayii]|uniref:Inter-alpha-trypsin inhibitor heavy chain H3-like n=1 Tax=Coilia grayii TaxID=363190 RepID=A0ABD1J3R3_9TELE